MSVFSTAGLAPSQNPGKLSIGSLKAALASTAGIAPAPGVGPAIAPDRFSWTTAASAAASAPASASNARTASASKQPPMQLAFDVYLDLVKTPQQQAQLLNALKGQLRPGDTIWLAVESSTVAQDPQILDRLAAAKQQWESVLGPEGVNIQTRIRFERIQPDSSSFRPGMVNVYNDVLKERQAQGLPVADAISYDYEAFGGFSGDEYTPHNTANAAKLFAQGQQIAKQLGVNYFVEPSVSAVGPHVDPLHHVTLNWQQLAPYTDGFNFQTQRIVAGSSKNPTSAPQRAADNQAYGRSVGKLVEGLTRHVKGKKDWVMAQLSTEWSTPQNVVAAAATARDQAPDIKAYYIWWYDTGRSEQTNVNNLLSMVQRWNKTFKRGNAQEPAQALPAA